MPGTKRTVFCYITSGRRLLVFTHVHIPEAGIQVPAGTMRPGAAVVAEALREAGEETGLTRLEVMGILGAVAFDARPYGRDEIHFRTFVHLRCDEATPDRWEHWETDPDDSPGGRFLFALEWVSLDAPLPRLSAGHDAFIPLLKEHLHRHHGDPP